MFSKWILADSILLHFQPDHFFTLSRSTASMTVGRSRLGQQQLLIVAFLSTDAFDAHLRQTRCVRASAKPMDICICLWPMVECTSRACPNKGRVLSESSFLCNARLAQLVIKRVTGHSVYVCVNARWCRLQNAKGERQIGTDMRQHLT